jgi:hypothetical protein
MAEATRASGRCAWTGERSDRLTSVVVDGIDRIGRPTGPVRLLVLPEHETALRDHVARARRFGLPFLVGVVVIGVLAFGLAMTPMILPGWEPVATPLSGLLVILLGLLFVAFPFTTPETSAFFGLRASIRIARVLGLLLAALGAWITLL